MRSRDIAAKLTVNRAIECERVNDRKMLALPSGSMLRPQRFGRGPHILAGKSAAWRTELSSMTNSRGWLF